MLKIVLAFVGFTAILTLILWAILDKLFLKNLPIIIICEIFLLGIWIYGAYELICYERKKLRELLAKKDKKLKKQADKIAFKNSQLSTLLSGISHELKNPLFIIKMSANALKSSPNLSNNLAFLEKIDKNADRMQKTLANLRLLFVDKKIILNTVKINLLSLSKNVVNDLNQKYQNRVINIKGQGEIIGDYDMFYQAIFNICENALKYSSKDIFIWLNWRGIFVRDFGIGMGQKELKLAQKRLYKSHIHDWNSSMGLGLFLVRKVVRAHGFEFVALSLVGKGSLMGIYTQKYNNK